MKKIILDYTFDKDAGTITFPAFTSINLENVLLITNLADGVIIFNFADPTKGGSVATNVLTLAFDTTAMDNADPLQIHYWVDAEITILDEPDMMTTYVGYADAGTLTSEAKWKITRLEKVGTVQTKLWADGNQRYDNIWDNRTMLSYS